MNDGINSLVAGFIAKNPQQFAIQFTSTAFFFLLFFSPQWEYNTDQYNWMWCNLRGDFMSWLMLIWHENAKEMGNQKEVQ